MRQGPAGFSLVELLVVIAIIAILIAILIPVLGGVRKTARGTACLANLQQWGQAFQMYGSAHNRSVPIYTAPDLSTQLWWETLAPFHSDIRAGLICPEAVDPRDNSADPGDGVRRKYPPGSAAYAWRVVTYDAAAPKWTLRGDWRGSYGINCWVLAHNPRFISSQLIRFPAAGGERVPLLGDCQYSGWYPNSGTDPPKNVQDPEKGAFPFCIDRHRMAINVVFLDGHAERVPLAGLWKLKWNEFFTPRDVVVPKP